MIHETTEIAYYAMGVVGCVYLLCLMGVVAHKAWKEFGR